jgi:hypothetical protein
MRNLFIGLFVGVIFGYSLGTVLSLPMTPRLDLNMLNEMRKQEDYTVFVIGYRDGLEPGDYETFSMGDGKIGWYKVWTFHSKEAAESVAADMKAATKTEYQFHQTAPE